jgi:hypothetical protein
MVCKKCPQRMQSRTNRQDLLLDFLRKNVKTEEWFVVAFSPTLRGPFDAHVLYVRMLRQIEENLIGAAVELLRKSDEGFRTPLLTVDRSPQGNVQALLFNDTGDAECQKKDPSTRVTQIQFGTVAGLTNNGLW